VLCTKLLQEIGQGRQEPIQMALQASDTCACLSQACRMTEATPGGRLRSCAACSPYVS